MSNMDIRFSQSSPSNRSDSLRSGTESAPPAPDTEATDRFLKALEEKPDRHDMESGQSRKEAMDNDGPEETPRNVQPQLSGMTSPLDSLFSGRMEQVPALAAQMQDTAEIEQLVERILVSTPEKGGHEVRISLGSQTLPGTEIVLQRGVDGMLSVTVNCTDGSSFQTLVAAQDTLQSRLSQMENADVRVVVTQDSDREENDSGRRSRGYMEEDFFNNH